MAITASLDKPVKKQASDNAIKYNRSEMFTGLALDFNGSSDNINVGDTSQDCKTLICWVYPDTDTEKIIDLDGGTHVLGISSGTVVATGFSNPTIYIDGFEGTAIETGAWFMIAVTTPTAIDMNALNIGKESSNYFEGGISNVMAFNTYLSANQIAQIWSDPARPVANGLSTSDLVLWLPLLENNSTIDFAFDYSGNNNHTAITGTSLLNGIKRPLTQTATTGISKKICFDGTDDYIDLGTLGAKSNMSISACVLTSTFAKRIFTYGDVSIELASATTIKWHSTTSNSVTFTVNDYTNKLTHIVITQTGTTAKLYINGALDETLTATATSAGGASSYIGRNGSTYYDGFIDEVALWNEVITPAAITKIYNSGKPLDLTSDSGDYINSDTLLNYWRNEGNNTWTDLGSGGNNGTPNGTPEEFTIITGTTAGRDGLNMPIQYAKGYGTFYSNEHLEAFYNESFALTSKITIEAWIRVFDLTSDVAIVEKEDSFYLGVTSSGEIDFSLWQTTKKQLKTAINTIAVNTWYHVVCTYDGTTRNIYVDSAIDTTSTAISGTFDDSENKLTTATSNGVTANNWLGNIDELRIYSAAIDAGAVLTNYRAEQTNHTN